MPSPTAPPAARLFDRIVLGRPRTTIALLLLVFALLAYHARDFRLDASAETLMLENDPDLAYFRTIAERYGEQEFLLVTYRPRGDLLSPPVLDDIGRLRDALRDLPRVASVVSILDVPLLESPPLPVKELAGEVRTLRSPETDIDLARRELRTSPLYRDLLVSPDLRTTALQINFPPDTRWRELLERRRALREKRAREGLTAGEADALEAVGDAFRAHRDRMRAAWHETIVEVRRVMDRHRDRAELFLGGVNMIADDMIRFVRGDLETFGLGVLALLVVTLWVIFRGLRWIAAPLLCCSLSALAMIGLLGWCDWEVTVISSNFVSLQLIITMAITIHLTVRYRELFRARPAAPQRELVGETVGRMFKPCAFATLTTIAGFASLVLSGIKPVITFGWMMIAGLVVSMVVTFLLYPSLMVLLPKERRPPPPRAHLSPAATLARFTERRRGWIVAGAVAALAVGAGGAARLEVENAFIDYFKSSTEIHRGMRIIDRELGGTTPLDVVITLPSPAESPAPAASAAPAPGDPFAQFGEFETAGDQARYWFTADKMARVMAVHDYLDGLPETGKVLSLATPLKIARRLNDGRPLDNFQLALLYAELPEEIRRIALDPYVSVDHDEVRFNVRIVDSRPGLRRDALIERIRTEIPRRFDLAPDRVRLTGMLVLYNNTLQSLFRSQILTLGVTVLALMGMFLVLFRSLRVALIAIFPNLLSIGVVLGFMGWAGIPLDMMTITIAAISVGIAVDDTIHYIHRFRGEFAAGGDYREAMHRSHGSIGHAMYYTSVTIIMGFSILVLSNFIPTIYFGLLTSLAMLIALVAALTLLPALILLVRPFGPQAPPAPAVPGN